MPIDVNVVYSQQRSAVRSTAHNNKKTKKKNIVRFYTKLDKYISSCSTMLMKLSFKKDEITIRND